MTYQLWAQLWSVRPYHQNFLGLLRGGPKSGLKRRGPPIEKPLPHLVQSKISLLENIVTFQIFAILTRRLSGFEILNNATLIFQKWLVSRHLANIFYYLNFYEEYL